MIRLRNHRQYSRTITWNPLASLPGRSFRPLQGIREYSSQVRMAAHGNRSAIRAPILTMNPMIRFTVSRSTRCMTGARHY